MSGKTFQDRELASKVRTKALEDLLLVLSDNKKMQQKVQKWSPYRKEILKNLSRSVLPRLNEVTGEDGQPLSLSFHNALTPQ